MSFYWYNKLFCAYKASISLEIGLSVRFVESTYNSSGDLSDHRVSKYLVSCCTTDISVFPIYVFFAF